MSRFSKDSVSFFSISNIFNISDCACDLASSNDDPFFIKYSNLGRSMAVKTLMFISTSLTFVIRDKEI